MFSCLAVLTDRFVCLTYARSNIRPSSTSQVRKQRNETKVSFPSLDLFATTIRARKTEANTRAGTTPPSTLSPTRTPTQQLSNPPPLLRLAASPHDAHLLATFAADSPLIRILDVRQPGTALLELRGHSAALNAVEWAPARRGMLASGADDALVLVWDLLRGGGAVVNGDAGPLPSGNGVAGAPSAAAPGQPGASSHAAAASVKGPAASWRCDYEVANLSWAPTSVLTQQGGEWVGVAGGRGVWGVKL